MRKLTDLLSTATASLLYSLVCVTIPQHFVAYRTMLYGTGTYSTRFKETGQIRFFKTLLILFLKPPRDRVLKIAFAISIFLSIALRYSRDIVF